MKQCIRCKKRKSIDCFYKASDKKDGLNIYCKVCCSERAKKYRKTNLKHYNELAKIRYYKNRQNIIEKHRMYRIQNHDKITKQKKFQRKKSKHMVISHYGNKCVCCDENNIIFLSIDHINNDGNKFRKQYNILGGTTFYNWIS